MSVPTVWALREPTQSGEPEALPYLPLRGRAKAHDTGLRMAATPYPLPKTLGVTHRSERLLADDPGVSFAPGGKTRGRWGLQPWNAETFAL